MEHDVRIAYSASWKGPPVPWEGRNQEVGVHRELYEERDHPWGPLGLQVGEGPPSLDLLQGESFDHQDQTDNETDSNRSMLQRLQWTGNTTNPILMHSKEGKDTVCFSFKHSPTG